MILISQASRFKASAFHLIASSLLAGLIAILVFQLWFPWPFRLTQGGHELFRLIVGVDVILGPLLTLIVFNPGKTRRHLTRDLSIIVFIQLAGLIFGLYTLYMARPVAMVLEVDRFRVVSYAEVQHAELGSAHPQVKNLSLTGPVILGTRKARNAQEQADAIFLAIEGIDIGMRPSYWLPYQENKAVALTHARPLFMIIKKFPEHSATIEKKALESNKSISKLKFVPIITRNGEWSALIDSETGAVVDYINLNGFF